LSETVGDYINDFAERHVSIVRVFSKDDETALKAIGRQVPFAICDFERPIAMACPKIKISTINLARRLDGARSVYVKIGIPFWGGNKELFIAIRIWFNFHIAPFYCPKHTNPQSSTSSFRQWKNPSSWRRGSTTIAICQGFEKKLRWMNMS
jgi:hypothetical protein